MSNRKNLSSATPGRGRAGKRPRPSGTSGAATDSRSSTPVSRTSGTSTPLTSSRTSNRLSATDRRSFGGRKIIAPAAKKAKRFLEDYAQETDPDDDDVERRGTPLSSDEELDKEIYDEQVPLGEKRDEDADSCMLEGSVTSNWSEEESTTTETVDKLVPVSRRPKTPEFIEDEKDIPALNLPDSSTDLLIDNQNMVPYDFFYKYFTWYRNIYRKVLQYRINVKFASS